MADAAPQTKPGRRYVAGAIVLSCGVAALGFLAVGGVIRGWTPVPFGLMAGATLIFVAIWNVATLDRQSEYLEGRWLTGLSILMLLTGLAGVVSSSWPIGLFLAAGGVVGLIGRTRDS
jgi:hypothetical protein